MALKNQNFILILIVLALIFIVPNLIKKQSGGAEYTLDNFQLVGQTFKPDTSINQISFKMCKLNNNNNPIELYIFDDMNGNELQHYTINTMNLPECGKMYVDKIFAWTNPINVDFSSLNPNKLYFIGMISPDSDVSNDISYRLDSSLSYMDGQLAFAFSYSLANAQWKLYHDTNDLQIKFNMNCITHNILSCYNNKLYWYDSCGNKEEMNIICANGCKDGESECLPPPTCSGSSTQSCTVGSCAGTQSRTCSNGVWSSWGTCIKNDPNCGGVCIPATEICNNIDDDCDGQIDEGLNCQTPTLECEIYQQGTYPNCKIATWVYIVGGFMIFIFMISMMKR